MISDLLSEAHRYIGRPYVHGAKVSRRSTVPDLQVTYIVSSVIRSVRLHAHNIQKVQMWNAMIFARETRFFFYKQAQRKKCRSCRYCSECRQ